MPKKVNKPIMISMRINEKYRKKLEYLRTREYGGMTRYFEKCLDRLRVS